MTNSLIALLLAVSAPSTIPSPPPDIGPYQGAITPPPPLVLNDIEQELRAVLTSVRNVTFVMCNSPSPQLTASGAKAKQRLDGLFKRLTSAVERGRAQRIFRDAWLDTTVVYVPHCPPEAEIERRFATFEKAMSSLDSALIKAGH